MTLFLLLLTIDAMAGSIPDAWTACGKHGDCVVSEEQCYRPLAIHRKFLRKNEESNEKVRPLIQCIEYKGPPKGAYRAVCKEKQCTLELKGSKP